VPLRSDCESNQRIESLWPSEWVTRPKSAQGVAVLHWTGVKIVNRTHDDAMQTGTTLSQSVIDDELSWVSTL